VRRAPPFFAVAALCAVIALAGPGTSEALRYDRDRIWAGQLWRLLTGNLVHLGWGHLAMNVAALLLIAPLAPAWVLLPCGLGVSAGLLFLSPETAWYVGLSGALHGLFASGALAYGLRGSWGGWGGLGLLAAKLAYEAHAGPLPGSADLARGPILLPSHFYGALSGLPWALLLRRKPLA